MNQMAFAVTEGSLTTVLSAGRRRPITMLNNPYTHTAHTAVCGSAAEVSMPAIRRLSVRIRSLKMWDKWFTQYLRLSSHQYSIWVMMGYIEISIPMQVKHDGILTQNLIFESLPWHLTHQ